MTITLRDRPLLLLLLLLGAGSLACATRLEPAPDAEITEGPGEGAIAREQGVQVEARVQAWNWTPTQLEDELTPVLVEIDNESERPLRVRFEDFALVDADGRRYAALPPFDIDAEVDVPLRYAYGMRQFSVAAHLGTYYPTTTVHPGPFDRYALYYDSWYGTLANVQLPTSEMLVRALPEGVIEADGGVAGFLYFEHVEDPAGDRVDFRYELYDMEAKERFGRIQIPFRLDSGR